MEPENRPADPIAMVAFHSALRRDLRRTRILLDDFPDLDGRSARLGRRLRWLVEFLRWHHEGEDEALWPLLSERDPELRPLLAEMEAEHAAVDQPLAALDSAGRGLVTGWGDPESVRRALDDLESLLDRHLAREERLLLPHVARLMSQKDWDDFQDRGWIRGSTPAQLLQFVTWLTDRSRWSRDEAARFGVPWVVYRLAVGPLCMARRRFSGDPWLGTRASHVPPLSIEAGSAL